MKPTIEELYPELSPEEQARAQANLERYAAILLRMLDKRQQAQSKLNTDEGNK